MNLEQYKEWLIGNAIERKLKDRRLDEWLNYQE